MVLSVLCFPETSVSAPSHRFELHSWSHAYIYDELRFRLLTFMNRKIALFSDVTLHITEISSAFIARLVKV
jgi:hypothetical protein